MVKFNSIKEAHIKIIICLLAIISFFSTINILPPLDRDESRYIQSTMQMIETGDPLNIKFLDTPRLKKPPGIYWLQASSAITIQNMFSLDKPPVWSFRLPSAIATSISLLLLYLLGSLIFGRLHGVISALLFLSAPIVIIEANIAKTDAVLTCITLAIIYLLAKIVFYKHDDKNFPSKYIYLGWLLLGFSFLIKGPITFSIIFLLIICFTILEKDFQIKSIKPVYGILLFSIIFTPWFVYILFGSNANFLVEDVKNDFLAKLYSVQESHGAPPGSYIISLFFTAWPIAVFLLPTFVWSFLHRKEKNIKFLLSYIMPSWIVLELIPTKLVHYILPLMPGISLLTAAMLVDIIKNNNFLEGRNIVFFRIFTILPIIAIGVLVCGIIYIGSVFGTGISKEIIFVSLIFSFIGIISVYYFYCMDFGKVVFISTIGSIIAINLFLVFIPKQMSKIWVSERIYNEFENQNTNNTSILLGYAEPSLVYRLGSKTKIAGNSEELISLVKNLNIDYVIIEDKYIDRFKILSKQNNINYTNIGKIIHGFNYSKGENIIINIFNVSF